MIDDNDLGRLAAMAHALRPDWPIKSLMTYLHAKHAGRPYRDLAVALAWVACDTATKTPKRIEENGPWWSAAVAGDARREATPMPPKITKLRCGRCGFLVVTGEQHACGQLGDPHAGAAAARAAIRPTVSYETEGGRR